MIKSCDIVLPPLNSSSPTQCSANRINRSKNFSYSVSLYNNTASSQTTTDIWLTSIRCLCQHSHDDSVKFLIADDTTIQRTVTYPKCKCYSFPTHPSFSQGFDLIFGYPISRSSSGTCFFTRNPSCWLNTACLSLNLSGIDFIQQGLKKRL